MKNKIAIWKEKAKRGHPVLLISMLYSFAWSICKIVFGVFNVEYFFCVSGVSTLMFGFAKRIYLKNHNFDDFQTKRIKSTIISILLIVSGILFVIYMSKCFLFDGKENYSLILAITIATCSFVEFGVSIRHFVKAHKSDDILLRAFRGCSLASGCYAISLTQVALLSATQASSNVWNGVTGVVVGVFSILVGVYLLGKSRTRKHFNKGI